ncbi:SDR family oxidoreductase [Lacinutrix algicola]|uniref:SDR family oxidoreductase n=1 Tax=Lacinutrix algicola TaxID=342954 RepID=UPI0006E126F1|nr:SDR family oxidoreductase [Lacinutrix algicola]
MKIAVTSVSGNLGSAIAKQLIQEVGKDNVIGVARTPEKAKHLGIEIRKGDYNSKEQFNNALLGIEKLVIISGMDAPEKRIQQHRNIIEAAKANSVKKIVYTSIVGDEEKTAFSPIVKSNRQTEKDIQNSGLDWVIGRNGIYIEPDLEYIETYKKLGEIKNCAGDGKCTYTSRNELGYAYAKMLIEEKHSKKVYNLVGEPITQAKLADYINQVYNTKLVFNSVSVEDYTTERKAELGDFIGTVIAGIYEGILNGVYNVNSDYEKAAGRLHKPTLKIIEEIKQA